MEDSQFESKTLKKKWLWLTKTMCWLYHTVHLSEFHFLSTDGWQFSTIFIQFWAIINSCRLQSLFLQRRLLLKIKVFSKYLVVGCRSFFIIIQKCIKFDIMQTYCAQQLIKLAKYKSIIMKRPTNGKKNTRTKLKHWLRVSRRY